jgi:hypothetical protein
MSKFDTKEDLLATMQLLMDRLEMGTLTMNEMEDLVATSRAFYERTLILRYKSYEQEVYGSELSTDMTTVKESYQSNVSSIEVNETPTEMIENEKEKSASFDLSFSLFDQLEQEEDLLQEIVTENEALIASNETHHDSYTMGESLTTGTFIPESTTEITEESAPETTISDEIVEEVIQSHIEEVNLTQPVEEITSPVATTTQSKDVFDKMIERDNSLGSQIMGTRLDTLNGAFGLNEKLQLISELFNGSSELFYQSIQIFDALPDFGQAKVVLSNYSSEFSWDMESSLVIEFVQKIARRYV